MNEVFFQTSFLINLVLLIFSGLVILLIGAEAGVWLELVFEWFILQSCRFVFHPVKEFIPHDFL